MQNTTSPLINQNSFHLFEEYSDSNNKQNLIQVRVSMEQLAESGKLPLATSAQDIVPGEGDPQAEVVLIGEAAGRNEAAQRRPFVGVAGKLVNKQLDAVGLARKDVYITNIVKTRPPENRDPTPEEIESFREFLDQELRIIRPKVIVTLGRFSMGKFLPDVKISQVHGKVFRVKVQDFYCLVLPFYHPAAALRRKILLEQFGKDFSKLPAVLSYAKTLQAVQDLEMNVQELILDM